MNPGRNLPARVPLLKDFLDHYLKARESELKPGTLELHEQTIRYLLGYFGEARRLDSINRQDARAFKTALAAGELARVNKRKRTLTTATLDLHIRNARTIFGTAVTDDILLFNPFDRLPDVQQAMRDWHYVSSEEFAKIFDAASRNWQLLLGLARWAGLRRGEAMNLRWHNVDWTNNRLTVVGNEEWDVKDKEARVVPMSPELNALLLDTFSQAEEGQTMVIPPNEIIVQNIWRDFGVLCKRAGVARYCKPLHTLRKSCLTDWASRFPMHVVRAWAGHSNIETTATYYLQVSDSEFQRASKEQSGAVLPRKLPRNDKNDQFSAGNENADGSQPSAPQGLNETAGDRIRTGDVQLGKIGWQIVEKLRKPRAFQHFSVARHFRKASHAVAFFRILTGYFRSSGV